MYVNKEITETLNQLMKSLEFKTFGIFAVDGHNEGLVILEGESQTAMMGIYAMIELLSEKTDTPQERIIELIAKACKNKQEKTNKETQEKTKKENIK